MRDISLHLMDIIQNSVSAKASKIKVTITALFSKDNLIVEISDNGIGMDEEFLQKVTDPFVTTRTTRKIGLGVPLIKASAERADGNFQINSVKAQGTELKAEFKITHIDRLPLGDIAETFSSLILADPQIDYNLILKSDEQSFEFSSAEVKEKLGTVPITQYDVIAWIKEYIDEGIKITFGGVLDEIIS